MKVLGVSFGYHDSSAALVVDHKLKMALSEERVSRQKHDPHFPRHAIQEILKQNQLNISDIDHIVFHEDPFHKFSRVLTSSLSQYPFSFKEFANSVKSWVGNKIWAINTIARELNVDESQISYLNHHFSHAVQAFMGSGFSESAILVVDAVGDWSSSGLYYGTWENGKPKVRSLFEVQFPHSLGLVYSTFTAYLGFVPNDSECSTMALAAFGKPRYLKEIQQMISLTEDGFYKIDPQYFNFSKFYSTPFTKAFLKLLGPPRDHTTKLQASCFHPEQSHFSKEEQRFYDIAASIQVFLQQALLHLAQKLHTETKCPNLCYSGGVALNCVANSHILKHSDFKELYIPPDPGDGGTSIGSALYYSAQQQNSENTTYSVNCGTAYKEDFNFLDQLKSHPFTNYMLEGAIPSKGRWSVSTLSEEELLNTVSKALIDKKIVGWFQGQCEVGPRALGFRSILIRPDDLKLAQHLSQSVKKRAVYRPYAISLTDLSAQKILKLESTDLKNYRWMQHSCEVIATYRNQIQSAIHVDGSTRPQVCFEAEHPLYYRLLQEVGKTTGLEVLLNTSFNLSGYPIVEKPIDAILMFARTNIDLLVIGNTVFTKPEL